MTQATAMLTLLTGPVRSGKSAFALRIARESGREPVFIATAAVDPADPEMTDRVARHRRDRGEMRTIETNESDGPRLVDVLAAAVPAEILIVDSLGTWLSSLLVAPNAHPEHLDAASEALLAALAGLQTDAIVVAEETGWGVVPPSALGRAFRDRLGRLTSTIAGRAGAAYLIVAGYAIDLHAAGRRITAY